MNPIKLSILIATIEERKPQFEELIKEFQAQTLGIDTVQILTLSDNKEMSIGKKRQKLLEMSKGEYIVFFDDDDYPSPNYVSEILDALRFVPDSIGFKIQMTTNGKHNQTCCHRFKYKHWANNVDGYDFVRGITHFNPVKRALAIQVGFKDMRFGEDKDYSDRLMQLVQNEVFIDQVLFHYRYENHIPHNQKYGILK